MKTEHFGQAGHFCAASQCRFHLHTHVDGKCISTVGEYYPRNWTKDEPDTIGRERIYETMVFTLNEDGDHNGCDEDFAAYNDRDDANKGHAEMVEKYERMAVEKKAKKKQENTVTSLINDERLHDSARTLVNFSKLSPPNQRAALAMAMLVCDLAEGGK